MGLKQPDLLLLNDQDLAYAKVRLDERSLATAIAGLSKLDDSLARAVIWSAAWDMTRDAEMSARDFITLVLGNIGQETDAWGVTRIPAMTAMAVNHYIAPEQRAAVRLEWEQGLRRLLDGAAPGSDHQLTFARSLAAAARSDEGLATLEQILDGDLVIDGLAVDMDLRWTLIAGLAAAGRAGDRIRLAEAADNTISGKERAAAARAAQPDVAAKEAAWTAAMSATTPNETARSISTQFQVSDQQEVLAPFVERYLEAVGTAWETLGSHKAAVALQGLFPMPMASPELLERLDEWLATATANPGALRYVREGRAEVVRALAARALGA
ncbi:MAG: ERAP1-like C-terminal domain-containing protein [Nocardioides sp.]